MRKSRSTGGLDGVRQRLDDWRKRHGGPGRPIPSWLWEEAVAAAKMAGVEPTARALRLDVRRLRERVGAETLTAMTAAPESGGSEPVGFVEVEMGALGGLWQAGATVVRLEGGDGERVRVELRGGPSVDVVELAKAFWRRGK